MLSSKCAIWKLRIRFVTLFLAMAATITAPLVVRAEPTATVGYYDMVLGQGDPAQEPPIRSAGHTPLLLTDLTAADLAGVDVLFVQNPDNDMYGEEYLSRLNTIAAAVADGLVLIIHDRYVEPAETILPGGEGFNIIREYVNDGANIDVRDNTTLVTNGAGGTVDNATLDGGCYSNHGYTVAGTLPANSVLILSRSNPDEVVTFKYAYGAGAVIYSSIPLDFYLAGDSCGAGENFRSIYAPNVVAYGAALTRKTPQAQVAALRAEVARLADVGVLNKGQSQALTSKLDAAHSQLEHGNTKTATNQVQAFVNQVTAFHKAKKLTSTQAQPLLERAKHIIGLLKQ